MKNICVCRPHLESRSSAFTNTIFTVRAIAPAEHWKSGSVQRCPADQGSLEQPFVAADVFLFAITTAFTGLRPADTRKTENPPAATPVQRFVRPCHGDSE
jgi:hypothetical protein